MRRAASVTVVLILISSALTACSPGRESDDLRVADMAAPSRTFYFAEGCVRSGFDTFLCLVNPNPQGTDAHVIFFLGDGSTRQRSYRLPPGSRHTIALHSQEELGRFEDERGNVAMMVRAERDIVAERSMYFHHPQRMISGGHVVRGITALSRDLFFAEGCTGSGFDQWISVLNPQDSPAQLTFRFQTQERGEVLRQGLSVPPRSRGSFKANDLLGGAFQASLHLQSDQPVAAERSMYFEYRSRSGQIWKGGHCVAGAASLSPTYYFAEGSTRDGFEEWLTLQNPGEVPLEVIAEFQPGEGQGNVLTRQYRVEAGRRVTLRVSDEVGPGRDISIKLTSDAPFLAERPIYYRYRVNGADWCGGHCAMGIPAPEREWLFAEGNTGPQFHTWLCLQNPSDQPSTLRVDYLSQERGALPPRQLIVSPRSRHTVRVNEEAGPDLQLSIRLRVVEGPEVIAERPMYFCYQSAATASTVSISAVGDVNFGMDMIPILRANGYAYPWVHVGELLRSTDLAFANLECVISERGSEVPGKAFHFRGSPAALAPMRDLGGVDVVSQANNHSRDYGGEALVDSLRYLDSAGIARCGAGVDFDDAHRPAYLTAGKLRVAFLAYSDVNWTGWPAGPNHPGVADASDTGRMAADIAEARRQADLVVASFHWGIEREYTPSARQRHLARLAVDSGADLVLGHHPHVVQGFEVYKGRLIAYSLGNFVFNPGSEECRYTVLAQIRLGTGGFISATIYPFYISNGRPVPLTGSQGDRWLQRVASLCEAMGTAMIVSGGVGRISR